MKDVALRVIPHNSHAYDAAVALRYMLLRKPLGLEFSVDQLRAEADSRHIGCYVDGILVGCVVLKPIDVGLIQMRQLAVDEKMQGMGIGRLIVEYSETLAKTLGFHEITLHARETAVVFYERLGYAKVGTRFTEITLPHWVMVKAL